MNDYILKTGDVNAFSSGNVVEKMVMDKLPMSLWLGRRGLIKNEKHISRRTNGSDKQIRPPGAV